MTSISVIIPAYKRVIQTIKTIKILLNSNGNGTNYQMEIIVADCTPDDSLKTQLKKDFDNRIIYTRPIKPGVATNKNQGAKIATNPILIFCDSDMEVEPETIENTIKLLQEKDSIGALGGKVIWRTGANDGKVDRPRPEDRLEDIDSVKYVESLYSRYLATYKKVFWDVGGYDEEVFNTRGEGSDLSIRYWRAGYPLAYDESIVVHHVHDAPDSIALRVEHPQWGVAKDLLLLAYKYDLFGDGNANFAETVAVNFEKLGRSGYFELIQGIGNNLKLISGELELIDKQKKSLKTNFPFKFLEVFTDKNQLYKCIKEAGQRIHSINNI